MFKLIHKQFNYHLKRKFMVLLNLILGLLLFLLIANIFLSLIPIPRGLLGTLIAILIVAFAWQLVF